MKNYQRQKKELINLAALHTKTLAEMDKLICVTDIEPLSNFTSPVHKLELIMLHVTDEGIKRKHIKTVKTKDE